MMERILYNSMIGLLFTVMAYFMSSNVPPSFAFAILYALSYAFFMECYRLMIRQFYKRRIVIWAILSILIIYFAGVQFTFERVILMIPLIFSMSQTTIYQKNYNVALKNFKERIKESDEKGI